jgi:hypothetical protein
MKYLIITVLFFLCFHTAVADNDSLILESDTVEGELYIPRNIQPGPDNNIYVYDKKDLTIKVYSHQTGKFLRRIGREGQGPGEYLRFTFFDFTPDKKLFFTEGIHGHPWITFMELSGKFDRILKIDYDHTAGIFKAKMLDDRRILAEFNSYGPPEKKSNLFVDTLQVKLAIINNKGKVAQTVISIKYPFRIGTTPEYCNRIAPFLPGFLWGVAGDEKIVFTRGDSNILEVYNLEGKRVGQVKTPLPEPPEITARDIQEWRIAQRKKLIRSAGIEYYNRAFGAIEKLEESFYKRKQIIDSIDITPSTNILICRSKKQNESENRYDLINFKGESLASASIAAESLKITSNYIFYITGDEDGNPFLHCLKRKRSEKEDLMRLELRLKN